MMKPYDKITSTELKAIEAYVLKYASPVYCGNEKYLAEWNEQKEDLFELMGENLILPIGTVTHMPTAVDRQKNLENADVRKMFAGLRSEIKYFMYYYFFTPEEKNYLRIFKYNPDGFNFDMDYHNFSDDDNEKEIRESAREKVLISYDFEREYEDWKYVENFSMEASYADQKFKVGNKGRTMRMTKKEKKVKALNRFYHLMDMEVAEDYCAKKAERIEKLASLRKHIKQFEDLMSLNVNKVMNSEIILSIHPLDFMTMSDNTSNWSSCMSWNNFGSYRCGTVEMMNSASIVIAYSAAKEPMDLFDDSKEYKWNDKTWRELFIVTKDFIYPIKGYPYQNIEFEKFVMDKLAELGEKNCGFSYKEGFCEDVFPNFITDNMYNDTRSRCIPMEGKIALYVEPEDMKYVEFNYSGRMISSVSGKCIWLDGDYDTELLADSNERPYYQCPHCGEIFTFDKIEWGLYNGEYVCNECWDEN